jgi:hypothetical protein
MPNTENRSELGAEHRALLEAETTIKLARLHELCHNVVELDKSLVAANDLNLDAPKIRIELNGLLLKLNQHLSEISNALSDKYFDHRVGPQQLVSNTWELN